MKKKQFEKKQFEKIIKQFERTGLFELQCPRVILSTPDVQKTFSEKKLEGFRIRIFYELFNLGFDLKEKVARLPS